MIDLAAAQQKELMRSGRRALSHSSWRQLSECAWAYRQVRILRAPTLANEILDAGAWGHVLFQKFVEHLMQTKQEFAPQDVPEVLSRTVATSLEPIDPVVFDDLEHLLIRFALGFRLDVEHVWAAEVPMAIDWEGRPVGWNDPLVWFRGKADLALCNDWLGECWDWKTGRWAPTETQAQKEPQAHTYGWLFSLFNDALREVRVRFYYPRLGVTRTAVTMVHDWRDTAQLWRDRSDKLEAMCKTLEDEKLWAPTPGKHCVGCPVAMSCPLGIGHDGPDLGIPTTDEQAVALFKRLIVLDAQHEALTKGLKARVKDTERPIDADGMRLDFWPTDTKDYDWPGLIAAAKAHFVEPMELVALSADKLKKQAGKNAAFAKAVAALATTKGGTSFTYKLYEPEPVDVAPTDDVIAETAAPVAAE